MRLFVLFMLSIGVLCGSEAEVTLPEDALKAEAAYQAEVQKILVAASKDVTDAKERYAKELEKEMKDQLKNNGIAAANEVQSLIIALEKEDPLTTKFGKAAESIQEAMAQAEQSPKLRIVIQNAYVRHSRNGRVWNVKDEMQAAIDKGTLQFRPYELFKKITGIEMGGRLDCQFTINGKRFERAFSWRGQIDFEKIAEED